MIVCPLCKATVPDGTRFCPFDCTELTPAPVEAAPEPAPPSAPSQPTHPPAATATDAPAGAPPEGRPPAPDAAALAPDAAAPAPDIAAANAAAPAPVAAAPAPGAANAAADAAAPAPDAAAPAPDVAAANAAAPAPDAAAPAPGADGTPDLIADQVSAPTGGVPTAIPADAGAAGSGAAAQAGAAGPASPEAAPADDLTGTLVDDRYRVLQRLDEGGVGVVYLAEQVQLRRRVALKVLRDRYANHDELLKRFEREALVASRSSHPGCVGVLDFGTWDGRPYLVMEFLEGVPLCDHLDGKPLAPAEAARIARQIAAALEHTHSLGVIHRDVKPGNIMLCPTRQGETTAKLLDFGMAKEAGPAPGKRGLTQLGTVLGTPGYLAPEQGLAQGADERSDLYSLGVVLFEMLCGRKPFVYEQPLDVIRAHAGEAPPAVRALSPEVSEELAAVVARALEKAPTKRFQTAQELIAALEATPELSAAPASPRGRGRLLAIGIGLLVVAAVVGTLVALLSR